MASPTRIGTCPTCNGGYTLTSDGTLPLHLSNGVGSRPPCSGTDQPPVPKAGQ